LSGQPQYPGNRCRFRKFDWSGAASGLLTLKHSILIRKVNDFVNAPESAERLIDGVEGAKGLPKRHNHHEEEHQKCDQRRNTGGTAGDPKAANAQHDQKAELHGEAGNWGNQRRNFGDLEARSPRSTSVLNDLLFFTFGGIRSPDGAYRTDRAFDTGGEITDPFLCEP